MRSALTLFASAVLAGTAPAQLLQPVSQTRILQATAAATDVGGKVVQDLDNDSAPGFGTFDEAVSASVALTGSAATADGEASQRSTIRADGIEASGSFAGSPDAVVSDVSAEASGSSYLAVTFDLGVETTYALTGQVSQTGGAAVVTLSDTGGTLVQVLSFDGTVPVDESGTLPAGRYTLEIQNAGVANDPPQPFGETSGSYAIEFQVDSTAPSFCDDGDASLAACPCGNPGAPDTGCDLAQGTGGVGLELVEQTTAPSNRVTWYADGFPPNGTPAAVLLRGTGLDASGPVPFGDGLRCVSTPVVRLGSAFAIGGSSTHVHGHGAPAGTYTYQVWFRNTPAAFCDPTAAFNLSNGRTLTW